MATSTANLGIQLIDPSEYISPEKINSGFTVLDPLGLDYITENGYSGEWWFRKWKSGRAECGIDDKTFPNQPMTPENTTVSGLLISPAMSFGAYPFSFSKRPFVAISFNSADKSYTSYVSTNTSSSTTQTPNFRLNNPNTSATTIGHPHFGIFVVGQYK